MKILYAAYNNRNAKVQLTRFLKAMEGSTHQIKVAAYIRSSPKHINIDWTLNCLLNLYTPEVISLDNDNLKIYFDQVKYYSPDLIISDLEYFTSYIAGVLNIPIWQCSSSLINYALEKSEKYNIGAFKYFAHAMNREIKNSQRTINLFTNSNGNFVYSHFGDTSKPPKLQSGFDWIRPYHQLGKAAKPCQHYIVAGLSNYNREVISWLQRYPDSVAFIEDGLETYRNILIKDIGNQEEYFCNLKNSPVFVCQGQASFLADAFYNGKYSWIYPDYQDSETLLNSCISRHLQLGQITTPLDDLPSTLPLVLPSYNESIKFLHERIL